jgi:hypothetical protein
MWPIAVETPEAWESYMDSVSIRLEPQQIQSAEVIPRRFSKDVQNIRKAPTSGLMMFNVVS